MLLSMTLCLKYKQSLAPSSSNWLERKGKKITKNIGASMHDKNF